MNYYDTYATITAPAGTQIQDIIKDPLFSEAEFEKYRKEKDIRCYPELWQGPVVKDTHSAKLAIYSRGEISLSFFRRILEVYPSITIDIIVRSMGSQWYHFIISYNGVYEVFDEEDFRTMIEDNMDLSSPDDYELAYYYMVPDYYKWTKRLDDEKHEKVMGDLILFPEDLVPNCWEVAWKRDPKAFKKEIKTIVEANKRLKELNRYETVSNYSDRHTDDDELPF